MLRASMEVAGEDSKVVPDFYVKLYLKFKAYLQRLTFSLL